MVERLPEMEKGIGYLKYGWEERNQCSECGKAVQGEVSEKIDHAGP